MKPRCMLVCVNYDDILSITLPRNIDKFSECCVITSPEDTATQELVAMFPSVKLFITDAFTRHGAKFNKGLAMEEAFDYFGRRGWMLIIDADIVLPPTMEFPAVVPGNIYGAKRRMLVDVAAFTDGLKWNKLPVGDDKEIAGFFQLFFATDAVLHKTRPWYEPTFIHAGGCDAYFQQLWPVACRKRLDLHVLHIGPRDTNWFGRSSARADGSQLRGSSIRLRMMRGLKSLNKWAKRSDKAFWLQDIDENISDRVPIPGYTSTFKWFNSKPPVPQDRE